MDLMKNFLEIVAQKIWQNGIYALLYSMIKINDVVLTPRNVVGVVEGFHKDGVVTFALLRVYNSNKKLAIPTDSLRRHLWLND